MMRSNAATVRVRNVCMILSKSGHLAAQIPLHLALGFRRTITSAEEIVELGKSGLGRHVVPADHARARPRRTGGVLGEIDGAFQTLRAVHDHPSSACGL